MDCKELKNFLMSMGYYVESIPNVESKKFVMVAGRISGENIIVNVLFDDVPAKFVFTRKVSGNLLQIIEVWIRRLIARIV